METAAVQIISMTEVAVLIEDLSTLTHILEVALSILIPRVGVRLHQAPHALLHNIRVAIFLIVLPFKIDAVGVLGRLKRIGLSMHLCAGRRGRVNRSQLDWLF